MGKFMDFMDDVVFGPVNLIDRTEGLIKQVLYKDTGVRLSILRIDKGGTHTRGNARAILKKYGIATFGATHDATCLHFLVKNRQAEWAEYLLLHAGIQLQNPPINPKNYGHSQRHPAGWMPTPWSEREQSSTDSINRPNESAMEADNDAESLSVSLQLNKIAKWFNSE